MTLYFWLAIACNSSSESPQVTDDPRPSTVEVIKSPVVEHSIVDCELFSKCACSLQEDLVKITLDEADAEQCRAGKQMLSLGDMTQGCALARGHLKQLLVDNSDNIKHLDIVLPKSCQEL